MDSQHTQNSNSFQMTVRPYRIWPLLITLPYLLQLSPVLPYFLFFFLLNMPNLFLLQSLCSCCYICRLTWISPILRCSVHSAICSKVTSSKSPESFLITLSKTPFHHYPTLHPFTLLFLYNTYPNCCCCVCMFIPIFLL